MKKNLLIIESPNKTKTIGGYLSADNFDIVATVGHIRDLPSSNSIAYDKETFKLNWTIMKKPKSKQPIVDEIRKKAKEANKIYLATDPDREGEAISWHVYEILDKKEQEKCTRITFSEITKDAIDESFKNERKIDIDWVSSQFARRLLDRIVGYDLSKFVKAKYNAQSAGRVQSIALQFIYNREQLINNFVPKYWWNIETLLENNANLTLNRLSQQNIDNKNIKYNGQNIKTTTNINFDDLESAKLVHETLNNEFVVSQISKPKEKATKSLEPYKTASLQQDAINKLGWGINIVTSVAQNLYEGIEIDKEFKALITYPRTDSIRMSNSFVNKAKDFIISNYGDKYFCLNKFDSKQKTNSQDAHECIRVIDPFVTPSKIKDKVDSKSYKLYSLIWKRTIACLMSPSISEHITISFTNNGNIFTTSNSTIKFDGYRKIWNETIVQPKSNINYELNEVILSKETKIKHNETTPPARYTQASLIKELDESGIGRPSTYATMTLINVKRAYCEIKDKKFYMTENGNKVVKGLDKNFSDIMSISFTKQLEETLDEIADKKIIWQEWMKEFVDSFTSNVKLMMKTEEKIQPKTVGRKCPDCGSELVYRSSYKVKKQFVGCSNFPKCKYAEFEKPEITLLDEKCPDCSSKLVIMVSKRNKKFTGCSNYPKCNYIKKQK